MPINSSTVCPIRHRFPAIIRWAREIYTDLPFSSLLLSTIYFSTFSVNPFLIPLPLSLPAFPPSLYPLLPSPFFEPRTFHDSLRDLYTSVSSTCTSTPSFFAMARLTFTFVAASLALSMLAAASPMPAPRLNAVPRDAAKLAVDEETGNYIAFDAAGKHLGFIEPSAGALGRRDGSCAALSSDDVQKRESTSLSRLEAFFAHHPIQFRAGTSSSPRPTTTGATTSARSSLTTRTCVPNSLHSTYRNADRHSSTLTGPRRSAPWTLATSPSTVTRSARPPRRPCPLA